MFEKIDDQGAKLGEADVEKLEAFFGFKLPDDYRSFMLQYNGGRPTPDSFLCNGDPKEPDNVHTFYSLHERGPDTCEPERLCRGKNRLRRMQSDRCQPRSGENGRRHF